MDATNNSQWLTQVIERKEGYESEAVDRYSNRLFQLAQARLPKDFQHRIDPADIVQSAFYSFFTRHEGGNFQFEETEDIWRLLAAITFRKTSKNIRHHLRKQRSINAEDVANENSLSNSEIDSPTASSLAIFNEVLSGIIEQLPETHQRVLQMRIEGFSIAEISTTLGVSTRTVNRGIALIRKTATATMDIE